MDKRDSGSGDRPTPTYSDTRQLSRSRQSAGGSSAKPKGFEALIREEQKWLAERVDAAPLTDNPIVRSDGPEPWVAWTPRDHFGLALSGGGIRSATFNLGVLQALSRRRVAADGAASDECSVLDFVDYVSTVSGGGYVGGFWSRWLHDAAMAGSQPVPGLLERVWDGYHPKQSPEAATSSRWQRLKQAWSAAPSKAPQRSALDSPEHPIFPQPPPASGDQPHPEAPAIRHLREHSRFLMPRVGLFEYQTWGGLVALLGAMLPSLVLAAAVLTIVWHLWLALAFAFLSEPWIAGGTLAAAAALIFFFSERRWRQLAENRHDGLIRYVTGAMLITLALAYFAYELSPLMRASAPAPCLPTSEATAAALFDLDGCSPAAFFFWPVIPWVALATGLLLVVRPLLSSFLSPTSLRVLERLSARCLVPALIWGFFAATWVATLHLKKAGLDVMMPATAATTAGAAGLLVALRNWFTKPVQETRGSRLIERASVVLRPVLPQLLAYAAAFGMLLMVGLGIAWVAQHPNLERANDLALSRSAWLLGVSLVLSLGALVLDPRRIGLHEFYRSRIAGTFLGGWTQAARRVEEDVTFQALRESPKRRRPIHLVCATANDLSGDPLPGLYRGGRSAALSPLGLSLGRYAGKACIDELPLSSALTASAAAFNSQMGGISVRLGPVVSFIMSSLGLRLGLWVQHPNSGRRRLPPGRFLFAEMFGLSQTQVVGAETGGAALHLSDGGHFENLALYELVRRHCRFIIVCDAGADPQVAFDDLANATRRIREDFGAEIELDVEPLRPNAEGLSRQHAVIGTIHYGGIGGSEKGILLYIKPTLVGDEPTDVMQYRTRNPNFPHESTGDQFYDEAQWESYRRLGEHCAGTVFRFVEDRALTRKENQVERLFLNAVQRWQPIRNVDSERLAELLQRRDALLGEIREHAPEQFQRELFADGASALARPHSAPEPKELLTILQYCFALASLMNQIYHAARLETHWAHPSNQAWMAFLNRCASATSFRRWWPLLRPMCDDAMRDFVKLRFGLRVADPVARPEEDSRPAVFTLALQPRQDTPRSFALARWEDRFGGSVRKQTLEYVASLTPWPGEAEARRLTVGLLRYDFTKAKDDNGEKAELGNVVSWSTPELFVPPELDGAGFSSRLLDAIVKYFRREAERTGEIFTLKVTLADEPMAPGPASTLRLDPAHRKAREASWHFYRSRGFGQYRDSDAPRGSQLLALRIEPRATNVGEARTA